MSEESDLNIQWKVQNSLDISELQSLSNFCKEWVASLQRTEIVLLSGEMAAGKSEFVRQAVQFIFGISVASSPSYALHHQYRTPSPGVGNELMINHWDLFRLQGEDELESSGFWDQLQEKSLTFIEWPERLNFKYLPKGRILIRVEIKIEQQKRILTLYQAT